MDEALEKQMIRDCISAWMKATANGDVAAILDLMHEDVVFLVTGTPPMRGKAVFAEVFKSFADKIRIEARSDIQEIEITGNHAYCWNQLTMSITPPAHG